MSPSFDLIIGLGNPGAKYEQTRHNAGFWLLDRLAVSAGACFKTENKFHGLTAAIEMAGHRCRLLKPSTYMNRSGQSVVSNLQYYKIPLEQMLVVHDDIDLEPGCIRLKRNGGHGGHNGLRDIIAALGGRDFYRLRIGVGHPGSRDQVVDYVLCKPSVSEYGEISAAIDQALSLVPEMLQGNFERVMQNLHSQ